MTNATLTHPSDPSSGSSTGWRERGSASIQMVVLLPALFTVLFLGVQSAILYQARSIALAAADEGARRAAQESATLGDGLAAATEFLAAAGSSLTGSSVSGTRSITEARVVVTARTTSLVPGWTPSITQSATRPVERVTG